MKNRLLPLWIVVCVALPAQLPAAGDSAAKSASATAGSEKKTAAATEKTEKADKKDPAEKTTTERRSRTLRSDKTKADRKPSGEPSKEADAARKETKDSAKTGAAKTAAKPDAKAGEKAAKTGEKPAEKAKAKKTAQAVVLTVRGEYPEGPTPLSLFGDLQPSLDSLIQRMTNAAEDSSVAAVVLKIEDLEIGLGKVYEIAGAVAKIRAAKKPTLALLGSANTKQYLLAAQCDQVCMAPSGMLILPGLRAEMTFYKGLLDKIGVEAEILQQGKYKGAGEPFTREKMSPALRESMEAIIDDAYGYLAETLAERRHTAEYRLKTLMDEGLFSAAAAKKAGLIDELLYEDQIEGRLAKQLQVDEVSLLRNYKKKKVDTDFSGLGGMMKLMELMFGGAKTSTRPSQQKKIAVVYAVGAIVEGKGSSDPFGDQAVGSSTLVAALRTAAEDSKVAAVVLRVDSPGGSAVGSDLIWRETVRMKKPVIASMGDVAGSGGYYIAMGADKIYASPATLTGSIGVIGGKVAMRKLYDKIGLTTDVISRGKISGMLSSTDPFTPDERQAWSKMLADTYRQFVSKAAEGRKMEYKELHELAQGRVYTGRMAVKNRLVDGLGTLQDAIAEAKKAAQIKPDEKVEVIVLPQPKSFIEQLFGDASVGNELDAIVPGLGKAASHLRVIAGLFRDPAVLLMPCRVELK